MPNELKSYPWVVCPKCDTGHRGYCLPFKCKECKRLIK